MLVLARRIIAGILVVAMLTTGYLFIWGRSDSVAVVNGQQIARAELASRVEDVLAEYSAYGMEITEEVMTGINQDVLDELIAEALMLQAAKTAGIAVTDEDVDAYYQTVLARYETEEEFLQLLADNDYTLASFRAEVAEQLAIQRFVDGYIEENVDPAALAVSEAEMLELYDYYAGQYEDIPLFEEVKGYLEQELHDQKLNELRVIEQIIQGLKDKAEIRITL